MSKAAGYHNIKNCKFVKRVNGVSGTDMLDVIYAKSLSLTPSVNEVVNYADGRKVISRRVDNGDTGNIGFTARDRELETAAGMLKSSPNGVARTSSRGAERFDEYYEFIESMETGVDRVVKVWLLNVSIGRPEENHSTDTDTIEFGDYIYPITVYGDLGIDEDGGTWVDENGMDTMVTRIFSTPEDTGYATFGDTVPKPTILEEI